MNFNWKAILEMIFDAGKIEPIPPKPDPVVDPPQPDPGHEEHIFIADMDLIPERMRNEGGIVGDDGHCYYALACSCRGNRDWSLETEAIKAMYAQESKIQAWYDDWMEKTKKKFLDNPKLTGTILLNDGKDKVGCTLGPAIEERLIQFADRLEMGTLIPESEYENL